MELQDPRHSECQSLVDPAVEPAGTTQAVEDVLAGLYAGHRDHITTAYREISFKEYLELVFRSPWMLRNSAQYLADAMDHYGSEVIQDQGSAVRRFRFTSFPWLDENLASTRRIIGHDREIEQLYTQLCQFGKQERANRLLVLHGMPGSGKTRIINAVQELLEDYSANVPDGARFRLVWVFDKPTAARVPKFAGFGPTEQRRLAEQDADPDGLMRIPASLNTDPFFLLPAAASVPGGLSERERVLKDIIKHNPDGATLISSRLYILGGKLDSTSQAIYEGLLRYYQESPSRRHEGGLEALVENHVRVERWTASASLGRGIAQVDLGPHLLGGAVIRGYNEGYMRVRAVPDELENHEHMLYFVEGPLANAARGLTIMPDFMRREISQLRQLMDTVEYGTLPVHSEREHALSRSEEIETVFVGTANNVDIVKQSQGEEWDAFKQKSVFITIAAPTSIGAEREILQAKLSEITPSGYKVTPHTLEVLALFAVGTRLLKPSSERYKAIDAELEGALRNIGVVEKALLLGAESQDGDSTLNDINLIREDRGRLTPEQLRRLWEHRDVIAAEYRHGVGENRFIFYDGGQGMTREVITIIERAVARSPKGPLTALEVLEVLEECSRAGFKYDAEIAHAKSELREKNTRQDKRDIDSTYPIPSGLEVFKDVARYAHRKILFDIHQALGVVSPDKAADLLKRYLFHVRAYTQPGVFAVDEAYRLPNRKDVSTADLRFLEQFEKEHFQPLQYSADSHRKNLIKRLVNWATEHPNVNALDNFGAIFEDLVGNIMRVQRDTQQKTPTEFKEDVQKYGVSPETLAQDRMDARLSQRVERYERTLKNLVGSGYEGSEIPRLVTWALSNDPISAFGAQRWNGLGFGSGI